MTSVDRRFGSLGRRTVLAMAIAVVGLAGAPRAHADPDLVDLQVVDRDTGQPLQTWRHHGHLFVAGEPGARYGLRVTNHTGGRLLVILSVDGVNVLTGETASYGQRGYVYEAYQTYDVNGWRKSTTEVADFTFAPLPQSYAARTGRPTDVGVIGLAVFTERAPVRQPPVPQPYIEAPAIPPEARYDSSRSGSALAAPSPPASSPGRLGLSAPLPIAPAPPIVTAQRRSEAATETARQDEKLGTAHGAREWSVSTVTTFERASSYPQSIRQVEYNTYANLIASGVIPRPPYAQRQPRPFPLNPNGLAFVPDPPIEP